MAAQLSEEPDVEVETVRGGLGELSVRLGDRELYDSNRLLYPRPGKVVREVKRQLSD